MGCQRVSNRGGEERMAGVFERYKVIDVDTHVTEPPDVWTSRVSSKWGDLVPHVVRMGKKDMWMIGDKPARRTSLRRGDEAVQDYSSHCDAPPRCQGISRREW